MVGFQEQKALQCLEIKRGAWAEINPATIQDCISMQAPTLGAVGHYCGKETAAQVLSEIITATALLLNVGKNLRAEQIAPMAEILESEFRFMNIADIRLAMKRGILGKYGAQYDRFDIQVVSEWLTKFWEERLEEGQRIAEKVFTETSPGTKPPQWFTDFVAKYSAKHEPKTLAVIEPDAAMIQVFKTDWDLLENPKPKFETYVQFQMLKLSKQPTP